VFNLEENLLFSTLILGSVLNDFFYGDLHFITFITFITVIIKPNSKVT